MSSGDSMFALFPDGSRPTVTSFATLDTINDGSSVSTQLLVLDYAGATADEHATWDEITPSTYAGGGFSVEIVYAPDGTNASTIQWEIRAQNLTNGESVSTNNLYGQTAIDIADTPAASTNWVSRAITTVSHANAGSPAVGHVLRWMVSRDYDHTASADDMQLIAVYVREV